MDNFENMKSKAACTRTSYGHKNLRSRTWRSGGRNKTCMLSGWRTILEGGLWEDQQGERRYNFRYFPPPRVKAYKELFLNIHTHVSKYEGTIMQYFYLHFTYII
jgi:hypothetical protein